MIFSISGVLWLTKIITPSDPTGKHDHFGQDESDQSDCSYSHSNSPNDNFYRSSMTVTVMANGLQMCVCVCVTYISHITFSCLYLYLK